MRRFLLAVVVAWGCACGPPAREPAGPVVASPTTRLRAFTEHAPITGLAITGRWLFGATPDGLLRWDLRAKSYTWVGVDDGLPAARIDALTSSPGGVLWVATPGGVARGVEGAWTVHRPPPVGTVRVLHVPDEATVWVGGSAGLARLRGDRWERVLSAVAITAIAADGAHGLWLGTAGHGLLRLRPGAGKTAPLEVLDGAVGCRLTDVAALLVDGAVVWVAGREQQASELMVVQGGHCYSYAAQPPLEPLALLPDRDAVRIISGGRLLEISRYAANELSTLPQRFTLVAHGATAGARRVTVTPELLAPPPPPPPPPPPKVKPRAKGRRGAPRAAGLGAARAAGHGAARGKPVTPPPPPPPLSPPPPPPPTLPPPAPRSPAAPLTQVPPEAPRLEARPTGVTMPPVPTSVLARGDELWLGTRGLGIARVGKVGLSFLRTHELTEGAERLTVACAGPRECYVATGGPEAWVFDGERFAPAHIDRESGSRVLAVVRDRRGRVVAIHRGQSGVALRLSRLTAGAWVPIAMQELEVPNNVPEIAFAQFSPKGTLWIGLHYKDVDGEDRPYGAAEVDLDEATVVYHRTYARGETQPPDSLALPNDVTALMFRAGELWFATKSGACRVRGREITLYNENQGLESELLRDIEEGPGGQIWVASNRGIGRFDGTRWRFERTGPLGGKVRALARGQGGRLWAGTARGLVLVDGDRLQVFGVAQGLLEPEVIDLASDPYGRVWALSAKGLTLVDR